MAQRPYDLELEVVGDRLRANLSGTFEFDSAKSALRTIVEEAKNGGVSKVLLDIREYGGEITILERFALGEELAALARADVALAFVDSPERVWPDRFFETVALNRGAHVKVTTRLEEATDWLDSIQRASV